MRIKLAFPLTFKKIAEYTESEFISLNDGIAEYITTDTRELKEGDLFVAIKGETFDGNDYIEKAFENGAVCALCEKAPTELKGASLLICDDTVKALGALAREYLALRSVKKVAVTGSVGKTTTKEFICSVLSEKYRVHKTEGNHNNELGLPYTVLSMPSDTEILITEMGMCARGEIEYLSDIVKPDIAVITVIGSSHLEHLKTRENICAAKMEIVHGMKEKGCLIVNGDEPLLRAPIYEKYSPKFLSLTEENSDFRADNIVSFDSYTEFDFICEEGCYKMKASAIGRHIAQAAAFACAVGFKFGMSAQEINKGLMNYKTEKMRQNIYKIGNIKIIDDCYNASPESMRASCDVLAALAKEKGSRSVALLGDMKELGEDTRIMHESVGEYMAKSGLSLLFTYGLIAENYVTGAKRGGMTDSSIFTNPDVASPEKSGEALVKHLNDGDILLIKASRAMAAEKIINYLKEHIN